MATNTSERILRIVPLLSGRIRKVLLDSKIGSISLPQLQVLHFIAEGQVQVSDLARFHGTTLSAISKLTESLVQSEVLKRTPHRSDRRQFIFEMTPKGRELYVEMLAEIEKDLATALETVGPEDREVMFRGLELFERALSPGPRTQRSQ